MAYLLGGSIRGLTSHQLSGRSAAGLYVASAALAVLRVLALLKRRAGRALGSRTLLADAIETALTAAAAAAALPGTGLDAWLGWWWAVPAGGLAISALAAVESIESAADSRSAPISRSAYGVPKSRQWPVAVLGVRGGCVVAWQSK